MIYFNVDDEEIYNQSIFIIMNFLMILEKSNEEQNLKIGLAKKQ